MAFGVYVHIPYCLQRCVYCDFATYEFTQILPPKDYIDRVKKEVILRSAVIGPRPLDTLYFGGGTPSLLEPGLLVDVLQTLADSGFPVTKEAEVTLEINPATLDTKKIEKLVKAGFNRFSVGAQTFDEKLLKLAHRRHSAQDTRDTLGLLKRMGVNFSVDLLFALPTQTTAGLERDLDEILSYDPPHVSPYCLTVPESNPMAANRPEDGKQVEMFEIIEHRLNQAGLDRYEISNFAKPGAESRHNVLYWNDDEYWGIGLSSHSYLHRFEWGCRFWNPRSINDYVRQIDSPETGWNPATLDESAGERLALHQALTDFLHTALRMKRGISPEKFQEKFGASLEKVAGGRLERLLNQNLVEKKAGRIALTPQGMLLSNKVFEELTFLASH